MALTEGRHTGEYIISEASGLRSRDNVTIDESQTIVPGTILGQIDATLEASSAAKAGGNTGNGTLTLDGTTPVLTGAKVGVYTVRLTAAAANAGTFEIKDPDGFVIGQVEVGATFSNDVKFATADGSTDFIVGDGFDITVVEDDDAANIGYYVAVDLAGTDGSQTAKAIALSAVTTGVDEPAAIAVHSRDCEVNQGILTYPSGATAAQKAAINASLASTGIIVRPVE